jgi:hypothetical protein
MLIVWPYLSPIASKAFVPSRKLLWQINGKLLSGLSTPGGRHDKNAGLVAWLML